MSAAPKGIGVSFAWQGAVNWGGLIENGGCYVGVVELQIQGAKTEITVVLPHYEMVAGKLYKFPFECTQYGDRVTVVYGHRLRNTIKETHPQILDLKVEQVAKLSLKAAFFEESPRKGPATLDMATGRITHQTYMLRRDFPVALDIPSKLEVGQHYQLLVTSASTEAADLSATLKKMEKVEKKEEGKAQ